MMFWHGGHRNVLWWITGISKQSFKMTTIIRGSFTLSSLFHDANLILLETCLQIWEVEHRQSSFFFIILG